MYLNKLGRVIVFGGSGLMGTALVERLLNDGVKGVTIVDVAAPDTYIARDSRLNFVEADILHLDDIDLLEVMSKSDTIFFKVGKLGNPAHSAELSQALEYTEVNAVSFWRIILAANRCKNIKMIVDSSYTAVCDFSRSTPFSESDLPGITTNFYGLSKAILEDICLFANRVFDSLDVRFIRYPRVYSPKRQNFLNNFAANIANNEPIQLIGDPNKVVDLIHIDDAVEVAIRAAIYEGEKKIFHATYSDSHTLNQIVKLLCSEIGRSDHPVKFSPSGLTPREPCMACLADEYSTRELCCHFSFSLKKIIQQVLNSAKAC